MITNPLPIDIKDYRTEATKAVRGYVNRHFGGFFSEDDIEDIISEVVKRMWKARDTYDPTRKFFSWLWKIGQNAVLDAADLKRRHDAAIDNLDENEHARTLVASNRADWDINGTQLLERWNRILRQDRDKRLLQWMIEGYDPQEIAEKEGITVKQVYMAVYHLRERLQGYRRHRSA